MPGDSRNWAGGRQRPRGTCRLCGRLIWSRPVIEEGGPRHPTCVPNPQPGRRYGVRNV